MKLKENFGIQLLVIIRKGNIINDIDPKEQLKKNDTILIFGRNKDIKKFLNVNFLTLYLLIEMYILLLIQKISSEVLYEKNINHYFFSINFMLKFNDCIRITKYYKNGAVKKDSILINGEEVDATTTAAFDSKKEIYSAAGVSDEIIGVIEKVNANPSQLTSLIKGVDLSGYSLLSEFQDLQFMLMVN